MILAIGSALIAFVVCYSIADLWDVLDEGSLTSKLIFSAIFALGVGLIVGSIQ